jgi:hypothetical protein
MPVVLTFPVINSSGAITALQPNAGRADWTVYVWVRSWAGSSNSDSWNVSMDNGASDIFDAAEGQWGPHWVWLPINGRNGTGEPLTINPRMWDLPAGTHHLYFAGREAQTKSDDVIITNDYTFQPSDQPTYTPTRRAVTRTPTPRGVMPPFPQ